MTELPAVAAFVAEGAAPPPTPVPGFLADDDLDFLALSDAPEARPMVRAAPDAPRRRQAERMAETLGGAPLAQTVAALSPVAADTDGEGAWLALAALAAASGEAVGQAAGPLGGLVRRALASGEPDLGLLAAEAVRRLGLAELQAEVAALLRDQPEALGFRGVELVLDCLAETGDGRCVRVMEEALLQSAAHLSEHQAWRARHIVQLIRRDGRR